MYEQNTSMVAANEQNKFLLPAMVEATSAAMRSQKMRMGFR